MENYFEDNNIICIKDGLEEYEDALRIESGNTGFYSGTINNLSLTIKKVKNYKSREKNLIIINKKIYNEQIRAKIKKIFQDSMNIINPHYLFINIKKELSIEEQRKIFEDQNFFYYITENEIKTKKVKLNNNFIKIVFQRMKDISRLNEYIVNSFQTIVDSNVINQQKEKIEKLYQKLEKLSKIDVLTSVLNRRALFEAMETEKCRTMRDLWRLNSLNDKNIKIIEFKNLNYSEPQGSFLDHYGRFSCLMIDLDDFKQINDNYGHLAGDYVLRELGKILNSKQIFRENDIVGRYGGEEFVIILPETNYEYAKIPADRLRKYIEQKKFVYAKKNLKITISIGLSEFKPDDKNADELINRADKALYYAKNHGKNTTIIYEEKYKK